MTEQKASGITRVLEKLVVAAVQGAVTLKGGPVAGFTAGAAVASGADFTRNAVAARLERRKDSFVVGLAERLEAIDEIQDADEMAACLDEAVFQNFRRSMDALDDAAVGPLINLTAVYAHRRVDHTFRAIGRVLEDLSAEEIEALRSIVAAMPAEETRDVTISYNYSGNPEVSFQTRDDSGQARGHQIVGPPSGPRLIKLLKNNQLARTLIAPRGMSNEETGGNALIRSEIVQLLKRVFEA